MKVKLLKRVQSMYAVVGEGKGRRAATEVRSPSRHVITYFFDSDSHLVGLATHCAFLTSVLDGATYGGCNYFGTLHLFPKSN